MNKSDSIKNLAAALVKFQSEVNHPKTIADNPFFKSKYAPLDEVINVTKPILVKYGLSVIQLPSGDGTNINISTMIIHESGEYIESDVLMMKPDKNTPQGCGSAITYARRYSLSSMLGIASEADDDGNGASGNDKTKDNGKNAPTPAETITESQQKRLFAIGKKDAALVKKVLQKHNYIKTDQVKKSEYEKICKEIEGENK